MYFAAVLALVFTTGSQPGLPPDSAATRGLESAGRWLVIESGKSCLIGSKVAAGRFSVHFNLQADGPSAMGFAAQGLSLDQTRPLDVGLRSGTVVNLRANEVWSTPGAAGFTVAISDATLERLIRHSSLEILIGQRVAGSIDTSGLAEALEVGRACRARVQDKIAKGIPLVRPPAPPPPPSPPHGPRRAMSPMAIDRTVTIDDYPVAAINAGAQGRVRARLKIDGRGRPTDCTVLQSSGNADLDAATCRVMTTKWRYLPARNAGGRSQAGEFFGSIGWALETSPPEPPPAAPEQ